MSGNSSLATCSASMARIWVSWVIDHSISLSKSLSSKGVAMTMASNTASTSLGHAWRRPRSDLCTHTAQVSLGSWCCLRIPDTMSRSSVKINSPHSMPSAVAIAVSLKAVYAAYPPESAANPAVKKMIAPNIAYLFHSVRQLGAYRISRVAPEHIRKNRFSRFGEAKAMCRGGDEGRGVRSEATLLVMGCLAWSSIAQRELLL